MLPNHLLNLTGYRKQTIRWEKFNRVTYNVVKSRFYDTMLNLTVYTHIPRIHTYTTSKGKPTLTFKGTLKNIRSIFNRAP